MANCHVSITQRVGHDWATEMITQKLQKGCPKSIFLKRSLFVSNSSFTMNLCQRHTHASCAHFTDKWPLRKGVHGHSGVWIPLEPAVKCWFGHSSEFFSTLQNPESAPLMWMSCSRLCTETRPQEEQGSQPAGQVPGVPAVCPSRLCSARGKVHSPCQGQGAGFFTSGTLTYTSIFCLGCLPHDSSITTWATNVSLSYLKGKGLG